MGKHNTKQNAHKAQLTILCGFGGRMPTHQGDHFFDVGIGIIGKGTETPKIEWKGNVPFLVQAQTGETGLVGHGIRRVTGGTVHDTILFLGFGKGASTVGGSDERGCCQKQQGDRGGQGNEDGLDHRHGHENRGKSSKQESESERD